MENLDVNQYLCLNGTEHGNNFSKILLAIAQEIQSCSNNENISGKRNIFLKITKYKASITNKKYKINYLNQAIRILQGILKFLLKRKDREDLQMKSQHELSNTRFIEKFINKGYETLPETLKEHKECTDMSVLHKIKNILAYTHKYYSYLKDIRTKYSFLEQRNRFLQNKINILESHLDSLIKENKNLHFQILRSKRENDTFKHKNILLNTANGNELDKTKILNSFKTIKCPTVIQMTNNLPKFRSHLSLISVLLSYQKRMLQDVEEYSKKVDITNVTNSKY